MSASPSGLSNGQTPTPNGGPGALPGRFVRKPKPADPLRPRKKPVRRPDGVAKPLPRHPNGALVGQRPQAGPGFTRVQPGPANGAMPPRQTGWSSTPPSGTYTEFPLVTTRRALQEGLR